MRDNNGKVILLLHKSMSLILNDQNRTVVNKKLLGAEYVGEHASGR